MRLNKRMKCCLIHLLHVIDAFAVEKLTKKDKAIAITVKPIRFSQSHVPTCDMVLCEYIAMYEVE